MVQLWVSTTTVMLVQMSFESCTNTSKALAAIDSTDALTLSTFVRWVKHAVCAHQQCFQHEKQLLDY